MTQSSVTRLDRKNKKKPHATNSFSELVGQAQLNALKPYVQGQSNIATHQLSQAIQQFIIQERTAFLTRQLAFERLLKANTSWFSEDILAAEVSAVEDESQGLVAVTDGIRLGDKVRLDFAAKTAEATEWSTSTKLAIQQVGAKGPNGNVQTHEELEAALLGLTVGSTKEFPVAEPVQDGQEPTSTSCRVTIVKISRAPEGAPQ